MPCGSRSQELFQLDRAYEARYELTRRDGWVLPMDALGLAASAGIVASAGGWIGLVGLGAFLIYPVVRATQLAGQRIALRVDDHGITVGAPAPLPRRFDTFVPWSGLAAVYTWRTGAGSWATWHLGLLRSDGARKRRSFLRELAGGSVPASVPRSVSYHRRRDIGWRLDRDRLAEAIRRFAPDVDVIEVQ
jgi:hypothetical protein